MAFGSNDFPLGPNGQFPRQRISSAGNEIADPHEMQELYGMSGTAKLPVTEKDFQSSVGKVKDRMKMGKPHINANPYEDMDKYRPKYAAKSSLRRYNAAEAIAERQMRGNDEWLKRRKQRFPGLETVGYEKIQENNRKIRPATGMSGVGFFGRRGELGDMEQRYREDEAQSLQGRRRR